MARTWWCEPLHSKRLLGQSPASMHWGINRTSASLPQHVSNILLKSCTVRWSMYVLPGPFSFFFHEAKDKQLSTWRAVQWCLRHAAGKLKKPNWQRFWALSRWEIRPERRRYVQRMIQGLWAYHLGWDMLWRQLTWDMLCVMLEAEHSLLRF